MQIVFQLYVIMPKSEKKHIEESPEKVERKKAISQQYDIVKAKLINSFGLLKSSLSAANCQLESSLKDKTEVSNCTR